MGALLLEYAQRLNGLHVARLAGISRSLRKERELAFYGDLDFLPTEQYGRGEAEQAMADAAYVVEAVQAWIADQQGPHEGRG